MNKSKLSLSLVTSFIAAIAATGCGNKVTSDPKAIVSFTGYDGNTVDVITDDVYFDYLKTSSGIGKFYDAMLEVLIRYEYKNENSALWTRDDGKQPTDTYSSVESTCKNLIKSMKADAKKSASANNTTYKKEWEKVLEQQGVENEKELLQKLIYDKEKENVKDWYFRSNEAELLEEYIGLETKNVASTYPYHIRHILASISGGSSEFYYTTIAESEALKLYTIAKALKDGKESFGEIAVAESGDSSSAIASDGTRMNGSVGIMDRSTSFVNEFKLGLYAYDAIYSRANADEDVKAGLGITADVQTKLENIGLSYVPYQVFEKLNEFKADEKDEKGHTVNDGNSNYYPRNIYWNKYLNHHNVFVITNNELVENVADGKITAATPVDGTIAAVANDVKACGFRHVDGVSLSNDQLILCDENANPIVCVRSEHGIHFMIIERSIYSDTGAIDEELATYYTADEEVYNDAANETFVGYIKTDNKAKYKERAKEIESKITSFDSTYDYRLFNYFIEKEGNKISFNTEDGSFDLLEAVTNYIKSQQEYNMWNVEKTLNDTWRTYLELIEVQEANRIEERLIPETCALKFRNANDATLAPEYQIGGACYYAK